jgi:hypothetical protein
LVRSGVLDIPDWLPIQDKVAGWSKVPSNARVNQIDFNMRRPKTLADAVNPPLEKPGLL